MTIDTDLATLTHSDGSFLAGTILEKTYVTAGGVSFPYKVCVFTADRINLGSSLIVSLQGKNALSLRTRNHGDLTLGTQLTAHGGEGGKPTGGARRVGGSEGGG